MQKVNEFRPTTNNTDEYHFKYLGSIIQKDEKINSDVNHKIQAGWLKWRSTTEILCDHNILLWLKEKFYWTAIRPYLLYDTEC